MMKSLLLAGAATALAAAAPAPQTTAITGALVFDGTGAPARVETVVVSGDRIVAVGPKAAIPAGARIIDARGKALTPGLFDLHTHWTASGSPATFPQIATAYVEAGVTTVNDFNEAPEAYAPLRAWLGQLAAPHVNFAARISTPGGHGADWADQATTKWVNTPEAARAAVDSLAPYKPDLVKAFTDGWRYGTAPDNTSMDGWTLAALVDAAHAHGWKVVTHTVTVDRGLVAARAGVDSLAHVLQDRPLTAAETDEIRKSGMAEIPTLAVYDPYKDAAHPLNTADAKDAQRARKFAYALGNVGALHAAGVRIGVGTDAGMPMTPHGSSTLHELELLVRAGLTPAEALTAATADSAQIIGQDRDRGTIAEGMRADIDLFDGRPWEDIAAIHSLAMTMIDGRPVWGLAAGPLPAANAQTHMPSVAASALIDDFEGEDGRSSLHTLRTDAPDGGLDRTVEVSQVVPRDEGGHAMLITARMAQKKKPYAAVVVPMRQGAIQPADVTAFHGVRVEVRGDGCPGQLSLNGAAGATWSAPFTTTAKWQTIDIPFSSLRPANPRQPAPWRGDAVTAVEVGASCPAGSKLWMEIDNLRFF